MVGPGIVKKTVRIKTLLAAFKLECPVGGAPLSFTEASTTKPTPALTSTKSFRELALDRDRVPRAKIPVVRQRANTVCRNGMEFHLITSTIRLTNPVKRPSALSRR